MPKKLQKSLQVYISKLKKPTTHIQLPSNSFSSSTSKILSGCRYPKTTSFAVDRNHSGESAGDAAAATLSDIDRFLFENFKSLYQNDENEEEECEKNGESEENPGEILSQSPLFLSTPPNLFGSNRFFVSAGPTGSLVEEARMSLTSSEEAGSSASPSTTLNDSINLSNDLKEVPLPDDCIAMLTYSPDPYHDFRLSMQEMIEARFHHGTKVDWDFMEELLFCYLNLNEKKSYKYILSAFVDLVVVLRRNSTKVPARSRKVQSAEERRNKSRDVT